MTKLEIVQRVANCHNRLAQIMVSGDNAILMGDTLREMRALAQMIQKDIETENLEDKAGEEGS